MPSDTSPASSDRADPEVRALLLACQDLLGRVRYVLDQGRLSIDRHSVEEAQLVADHAAALLETLQARLGGEAADANPVPPNYRFAAGR